MSTLGRLRRLPLAADAAAALRMVRARRAHEVVMEAWPGHFSSPIPALEEVRAEQERIFAVPESIPGVSLEPEKQLELVRRLAEFSAGEPFPRTSQPGVRYWFENSVFGYGDALVLHGLLRLLRPRHLVEVGSGFSSAVILDTNDRFLGGELSCTFVDPYPERLHGLLRQGDAARHSVVTQPVQQVPLETFDVLGEGDVLFVDSSHVSKVGSDVNWIFFEVMPRLRPGVLVHVHDVFYPFEYPRDWVFAGRAWNEDYLVRSFLMFNSAFEVVLFNSYLAQFHRAEVAALMPLWAENPGGSLWLRRRA